MHHSDGLRPAKFATSNLLVLRRPVESAQYLAMNYTQRMAEAKLVAWVGSGHSYHNTLAETIDSLYKRRSSGGVGHGQAFRPRKMARLRWVDWYNTDRPLGPIGHNPPAEAEDNYYAALENLYMAA